MANELRIRQLAIGGLVEDNPLTSGATTLTSAGLGAVAGGVDSSHHLAIVLDPDGIDGAPEIAYVTDLTAGAGSATIVRQQEGTTARAHAAGTPWVHAPTLRDVIYTAGPVKRATGSSMTLNSTAIAELAAATNGPGTTGFDLSVPAQVGDILEWSFNGIASNEVVGLALDIYTMVAGSRVNPFGVGLSASNAGVLGVAGWFCEPVARNFPITGATYLVVASGDIASGRVTCRPHYVTSTAANKTLHSNADIPLHMTLKNLGPPT